MRKVYLHNAKVLTGIAELENNTVILENGNIADVISNKRFNERNKDESDIVLDMEERYLAPGFIDTHIHGLHGVDTTDSNPEAINEMSKALINYGVTSFCPTIYPKSEKEMIENIKNVVDVMGKEEGAEILGLHLEGPFISKNKPGVMNPEYIKDVDLDLMERLYKAANGNISIMTVAPEIKNMRELALYGTTNDIVMSAGHSDAEYDNMLEGMQAGILHSTHFFNAMRQLHHRDPGLVGGIMIHPNLSCEIIADGHHIHSAIIQLLLKVKPIHKLVLVTDSLRPTGQNSGKLVANGEEVYRDNGIFRRKSDDTIAGSSSTMLSGVEFLYNEVDLSILDSIKMASCNPATVIGAQDSYGYIIPGKKADITVFDEDLNIDLVFKNGEILLNNM